ncbi:MAG: UMP kinase [Planctomycetes bacterium]|nr:UMP kinase [Planctomycetota bacterium]
MSASEPAGGARQTAARLEPPRHIKRILLKISGESLGEDNVGVAPKVVAEVAEQIARVQRLGVEVAVVVGGGNLMRGAAFAQQGTNRATADHMGMLATAINALALQDALERCGVETRAACAVEMKTVMEPYIRRRVIRHLEKGRAVVLAGGTGNPYFTTDTAAALRATELGVDAIFKATKVDGVYTADPRKDPTATRFDVLGFREALDRDLQVMDRTAFTLCMENRMPIMVFDMFAAGNMERAVRGDNIGTWVL